MGLVLMHFAGGCGKKTVSPHATTHWVPVSSPFSEQGFRLQSFEGLVDVICLDDCPTLFSCLSLAKERIPGSVVVPEDCPSLYLGHVSEFIVRALTFYRVESSFETLHGYRLLLRYRVVPPDEVLSEQYADFTVFTIGAAAKSGAVVVAGAPFAVTTPFFFLIDGTMAEFDRRRFSDFAKVHGLPDPDKNTWEVLTEEYTRKYQLFFGDPQGKGPPECGVVVTECRIERPSREELDAWRTMLEEGGQNPSPFRGRAASNPVP